MKKYIIIIIAFCLSLSSCYNAKKATEQVNKADAKFPEVVAKLARDKYPCTDILKPDTAVIFKDTTVYIECPDSSNTSSPFEIVRYDTINNVVTKIVKVPVTLPIQTQYITKWFEDSAKLKLASLQLGKQQTIIDKVTGERDTYKAKSDRRGKENWIWRAIAIVLILWQFWKFYKRLTTIKIA